MASSIRRRPAGWLTPGSVRRDVRSIAGAHLFAGSGEGHTAVIGARAGRTSNAETVAACDRRLAQLRRPVLIEAVPHTCHGYGQYLSAGELCSTCGWGPHLPFPSARTAAETLAAVMGADDARAWFEAAVELLRWD